MFGANIPTAFNVSDEVVPGYPGMVVREAEGERILQSMVWGFPLPMKSKRTGLPIKPKPVNSIADLKAYSAQASVVERPYIRTILSALRLC